MLTSDNVKVMVSPCSPRWLVSDMINGELRSVRGAGLSREGTAHWSDSRVIVTIQSPLKWNETLSPINESSDANCNLSTYINITRIVAVDRRVWTGAACDSWAVSWTSEHKNVAQAARANYRQLALNILVLTTLFSSNLDHSYCSDWSKS